MTTTPFDPNRSVATLTIAELETFIRATIRQSISPQPDSLIPPGLDIEAPFDSTAPSFLDIVESHLGKVLEEAWDEVPNFSQAGFIPLLKDSTS